MNTKSARYITTEERKRLEKLMKKYKLKGSLPPFIMVYSNVLDTN